jgi:hypothetical protein
MRIAALFCLCFAVPYGLGAAECNSVLQVIKVKDRLVIKNTSENPIVAYSINSRESRSQDGSPTRTFEGAFGGEDSLGSGQSMEIGKADIAPTELSVDYVRFADGSQCGMAPSEQDKRSTPPR